MTRIARRQTREPLHFRIYGPYDGTEPRFYDPEDFPWVEILRANWRTILAEVESYRARHGRRLQPIFIPDTENIDGWSSVNLLSLGLAKPKNQASFPETTRITAQIPNLASVFVKLLEAGASLPAHNGDSNCMYRCHLGLAVPDGVERCGIEVGGERAGWTEGDVLVFNDAYEHSVYNETQRDRIILICDVVKPEYGGPTPRVCGRVLGTMPVTYLQSRFPAARRLPHAVLRALHGAASMSFALLLRLAQVRNQLDRPGGLPE